MKSVRGTGNFSLQDISTKCDNHADWELGFREDAGEEMLSGMRNNNWFSQVKGWENLRGQNEAAQHCTTVQEKEWSLEVKFVLFEKLNKKTSVMGEGDP